MSNKLKENNIIDSIYLNIKDDFFKEAINTEEKLNEYLKLKKLENDEKQYINFLKFNIVFYKSKIRNLEALLGKWIDNRYIPDFKEFEEELKEISLNFTKYVDEAIKSSGKSLNEYDLNIFSQYQKLKKSEMKEKLEIEYKELSLYNEVLNKFINILVNIDKNLYLLPKDSTKAIKEITFKINKIVKNVKQRWIIDENNILNLKNNTKDNLSLESKFRNIKQVETKNKNVFKCSVAIGMATFIGIGGVTFARSKENENRIQNSFKENDKKFKNKDLVKEDSLIKEYKVKEDSLKKEVENIELKNQNNLENSYEQVDYNNAKIYYTIYNEAYVKEADAKEQVNKLLNNNIKSNIVKEDGLFKIRIGSSYTFEEANNISNKIRSLSFNTYILAYDLYVEEKLIELNLLYSNSSEELENCYNELNSYIQKKSGYQRYKNIIKKTMKIS